MSNDIVLAKSTDFVNGLIKLFEVEINKLKPIESLTPAKQKLLTKHIHDCIKNLKRDFDLDLNEWLVTTQNTNVVYPAAGFQDKMNDMQEDSLIIYIKKAQLYKVYNTNNLEDFQNDENTHYRKSEYGPVYEVVRDSHPQKLMIVISDDIKNERMLNIKNDIIEFIKSSTVPEFAQTTFADLKVYSNDNNTEFVVSSVHLKNLSEKEYFIDEFIKFMQQKGNEDIANKIRSRPPCELVGARFYKLPTAKVSLNTGTSNNLIDQMISIPKKQSPIIINNNNTYIINNVNSNNTTKTMINSSTKITQKTSKKKTLKSFCKDIYDNKPEWYVPDTMVDIETIENAYRNYFDDHEISRAMISKKLTGMIFTYSTRNNGITKKKLYPFTKLKGNC